MGTYYFQHTIIEMKAIGRCPFQGISYKSQKEMIRFEKNRKIEENIIETIKKDFDAYYGEEKKMSNDLRLNSNNLVRSLNEKCLDDETLKFFPFIDEIRQKNNDEKDLRRAKFINIINKLSDNKT